MTADERFERIERVRAGLAEERRKDRDEFCQLWRDTQRQINELAMRVNDLTANTEASITRLATEMREADRRLEQKIEKLAEESWAADRRLG